MMLVKIEQQYLENLTHHIRGHSIKSLEKKKTTERSGWNSELVEAFTGVRSQGAVPVARKSRLET